MIKIKNFEAIWTRDCTLFFKKEIERYVQLLKTKRVH